MGHDVQFITPGIHSSEYSLYVGAYAGQIPGFVSWPQVLYMEDNQESLCSSFPYLVGLYCPGRVIINVCIWN